MQIAEPGAVEQAGDRPRKVGLGIDLGTTNSLIAHFDGQELSVLSDDAGRSSLPSVVHYGAAEITVGEAAMAMAIEASVANEELDYARAALRFERAAKLVEFEVEALIGHARMLVGTKDYQKAADLLERAQSLEPQPRVARYLQAVNNLNLSARNSI